MKRGEIVCGFEEHEHSLECYSILYEDIENDDVWRTSVPLLSGDRNADTVAVAASQIGYRESDRNFLVFDENNTAGYTRYGHWYGDAIDQGAERLENGLSIYAYMDWDAMFVSFVLDRAGIYDMGFDWNAGNWADFLAGYGIYTDATDYIPEPGDLVFFTPYTDGRFYVGIVSGVNRGFLDLIGETVNSVTVIYGDADNEVIEAAVDVGAIYGYGVLTPREDTEPEEFESEELESEVTVDESSIPETFYDEEDQADSGEVIYEDETAYPETPENEEEIIESEEPESEEPEDEDTKADTEESQDTAPEEGAGEAKAIESETEGMKTETGESQDAVPKEKDEEARAEEPGTEDSIAETEDSQDAASKEKAEARAEEPESEGSRAETEESQDDASEEKSEKVKTEEPEVEDAQAKTDEPKKEASERKCKA